MPISPTFVAILVCALVAAIILKATKKFVGFLFVVLLIVLAMKYVVPLVM